MSKSSKSSVFVAVAHRPLPTGNGFRTVYARTLADGSISYTPTRTLADRFGSDRAANRALDALATARGLVAYGTQAE